MNDRESETLRDKPEKLSRGYVWWNLFLFVVCVVMLLALPIRNLVFREPPTDGGRYGYMLATYIMLFLFSSLTLVFGWRAIRAVGRE